MTLSNYSITGEPADCVGSSNIKSLRWSINGAERNKIREDIICHDSQKSMKGQM